MKFREIYNPKHVYEGFFETYFIRPYFHHYADFSGKESMTSCWRSLLAWLIVSMGVAGIMMGQIGLIGPEAGKTAAVVVCSIWAGRSVAQAARRRHVARRELPALLPARPAHDDHNAQLRFAQPQRHLYRGGGFGGRRAGDRGRGAYLHLSGPGPRPRHTRRGHRLHRRERRGTRNPRGKLRPHHRDSRRSHNRPAGRRLTLSRPALAR